MPPLALDVDASTLAPAALVGTLAWRAPVARLDATRPREASA